MNGDDLGWPVAADEDTTQPDELYKAKLEVCKKRAEAEMSRAQAEVAGELALNAEYYKAIYEVAKEAIDRARTGAELVQKAATAIATVYAGVLALAFSVSDHPLPSRGLIPAAFLGLAIVLSTAYLAYLSKPRDVKAPTPKGSLRENEYERARSFILWTRSGALNRSYPLRASVMSLAAALLFLPAPFIAVSPADASATAESKAEQPLPAKDEPATVWPDPPAGTEAKLREILYTAQVAEAAELGKLARAEAAGSRRDDETGWWQSAGLIALLILIAPAVIETLVKWAKVEETGEGQLPGPMRAG